MSNVFKICVMLTKSKYRFCFKCESLDTTDNVLASKTQSLILAGSHHKE